MKEIMRYRDDVMRRDGENGIGDNGQGKKGENERKIE